MVAKRKIVAIWMKKMHDFQVRYAEFINVLHDYVYGMEDPEHEVNGIKNR